MKLRSPETPDEDILRVLHDVMVSAFKFGGNRRFLGQMQQILWGAGVVRAPSHFW